MPVDLNDPKMEGFKPLHKEWADDCPDVSSRRIRDQSHFQNAIPTGHPLLAAVDDYAAAVAGVELYGFYQNAGVVRQRLV